MKLFFLKYQFYIVRYLYLTFNDLAKNLYNKQWEILNKLDKK